MTRQAIQTRYLLGKLSDVESATLEERSFVDDNVFNEIEIAEDELIDAYVGGSLSAEDRERFENKLLRSERIAERVEFARLLSESRASQVMVHEPAKTSWRPGFFDFSFGHNPALTSAAAAALFLVVLGLPVFVWMRMRFEALNLERAAIEQQRAANEEQAAANERERQRLELERTRQQEETKAEEARLREQEQQTRDLLARANRESFIPTSPPLYPATSRSSSQQSIFRVAPAAPYMNLRLVLETDEDYDEYRAKISSAADDDVLDRDLTTTRSGRSQTIIFKVPAKDLPPGYYDVSVTGRTRSGTYEPVGVYSVQIVKK